MRLPEQISLFEPEPPAQQVRATPRPRPEQGVLRLFVLGSGSGGNSMVVEFDGQCLLVDAGFSARETVRRLRLGGLDPRDIQAIVLTHEHSDHSRGAAQLAKRFRIPVYASDGSWRSRHLRRIDAPRRFRPGDRLQFEGCRVDTFAVPHDARQPVGFVLESDAGLRLGVVADLGRVTQHVLAALVDIDVLVLEANHDERMLETGPYPWSLKRRVASDLGHLSNDWAAHLAATLSAGDSCGRLSEIVLYHLSRTNNCPALALETVRSALERTQRGTHVTTNVTLTSQNETTGWLEIGSRCS